MTIIVYLELPSLTKKVYTEISDKLLIVSGAYAGNFRGLGVIMLAVIEIFSLIFLWTDLVYTHTNFPFVSVFFGFFWHLCGATYGSRWIYGSAERVDTVVRSTHLVKLTCSIHGGAR